MHGGAPYKYFTGITIDNKIAACNLLDENDVDPKYVEANSFVIIANCEVRIKDHRSSSTYSHTPRYIV